VVVPKVVRIEGPEFSCASYALFTVSLRCTLISRKVMRNSEHPIRYDPASRVIRALRNRAGLLGAVQRSAKITYPRKEDVQAGEQLQLVPCVLKTGCNREAALQRDANLLIIAHREHPVNWSQFCVDKWNCRGLGRRAERRKVEVGLIRGHVVKDVGRCKSRDTGQSNVVPR
jgi:hypothetical protein